jgi:hypothetical protein
MERLIRDRTVAPLDSGSPGLTPEERRSWWEFCLGMADFLGRLIKNHVVKRELTHQLSRLQWIALRGTYVFAVPHPTLRGEQKRYVDLCVIMGAVFALIVDDLEGIRDVFDGAFGPDRFWTNRDPKWPAEAEALTENWLHWWKNWEHASSPIGWVKDRASDIHERDHTQGGYVRESDAMYSTPKKRRDHSDASLAFDYRETARDVMPLEEISDLPVAGVALQPRYTWMSVERLEADIRDDEDLRAYARLRHKGWKRRAAWERLGWETNYGEAVDRRYRRFRAKVKASGFEYQTRNIEMHRGLTDASCTVVKERLRFPVHPASEATLSGRVVYEPVWADLNEVIENE